MAKYVMVAQSRPKEGREEAYDAWQDGTHLPEVCAVPGVKSGRRYDVTDVGFGGPVLPCLAIYEIETDDPAALMAEMARRRASGEMNRTDTIDSAATILRFYRLRETPT